MDRWSDAMKQKAFDKIADGLNEVLEIARGTKPLKGYRITKSGKVEDIRIPARRLCGHQATEEQKVKPVKRSK